MMISQDIAKYLKNAPKATDGRAALEVYEKYKNKDPFPIIDFANEFGISIYSQALPKNQSGRLDKHRKEIIINRTEPITRHRFTIAHELPTSYSTIKQKPNLLYTVKMVVSIHPRK